MRTQLAGLFRERSGGAALDLAVGQLAFEFGIADHAVAGDLVDPKVLVEVLEVVFLHPAAEHQAHDGGGGALMIVGEDGHFDGASVGVGGLDDELPPARIGGPFLVAVAKLVGLAVGGAVARTFQKALAADLGFVPGAGPIAFLPGDEVEGGFGQDAREGFLTEDGAVNDHGQGAILWARRGRCGRGR